VVFFYLDFGRIVETGTPISTIPICVKSLDIFFRKRVDATRVLTALHDLDTIPRRPLPLSWAGAGKLGAMQKHQSVNEDSVRIAVHVMSEPE
jgi:hypothetical protein